MWNGYNKAKVEVKNSELDSEKEHENKVVGVFNMLSLAELTELAQELESELYDSINKTHPNAQTSSQTLTAEDNYVDDGNETIFLQDNEDINQFGTVPVAEKVTEYNVSKEDLRGDIKSLLNLKKYKVNILYICNLKEYEYGLLEKHLTEDKRWKSIILIQERKQIDEAVKYHMSNQKKRRDNRNKMLHTKHVSMKWESDMKSAVRINLLHNMSAPMKWEISTSLVIGEFV